MRNIKMGRQRSGSKLIRTNRRPVFDPRKMRDPNQARLHARIRPQSPKPQKKEETPHLVQAARDLPSRRYPRRESCQSGLQTVMLRHRPDGHQLLVMLGRSRQTVLMPQLDRAIITLLALEDRRHLLKNHHLATKTVRLCPIAALQIVRRLMSNSTMDAHLQHNPDTVRLHHLHRHRKCLYPYRE